MSSLPVDPEDRRDGAVDAGAQALGAEAESAQLESAQPESAQPWTEAGAEAALWSGFGLLPVSSAARGPGALCLALPGGLALGAVPLEQLGLEQCGEALWPDFAPLSGAWLQAWGLSALTSPAQEADQVPPRCALADPERLIEVLAAGLPLPLRLDHLMVELCLLQLVRDVRANPAAQRRLWLPGLLEDDGGLVSETAVQDAALRHHQELLRALDAALDGRVWAWAQVAPRLGGAARRALVVDLPAPLAGPRDGSALWPPAPLHPGWRWLEWVPGAQRARRGEVPRPSGVLRLHHLQLDDQRAREYDLLRSEVLGEWHAH